MAIPTLKRFKCFIFSCPVECLRKRVSAEQHLFPAWNILGCENYSLVLTESILGGEQEVVEKHLHPFNSEESERVGTVVGVGVGVSIKEN